ncbi:hypothetical protein I5654_22345 [Hafnia paralvei]|uniref:hypothetical protein n=1 Tax=Hafnia paralvei TaxID=546367 RepID=UPI001C041914|nr:hypothetical protein [Hafnia paralvei]MBU2675385.1 hypothetical protein [Hafnia paralvei]
MDNFIKSYSSIWRKTIDYTYLFDHRKMSNSEVVLCMIWIVLYALPLLAYVIFLLNPFPTNNEFGEHPLVTVWGAMLVISISGVLFREGANKRGNSSRLTQSFHFFMFEPIFSPVNALNQPI